MCIRKKCLLNILNSSFLCFQLGWSIGPKELIKNLQTVQAQVTYTLPTPTQVTRTTCIPQHRDRIVV